MTPNIARRGPYLGELYLEDRAPGRNGYVVNLPMVIIGLVGPVNIGLDRTPSKWPFTSWLINGG